MRLRFELQLALRHVIGGGWQTVGVCGGIAVAVLLVILVPAIGQGMQQHLGQVLSESLAAVTVKPRARTALPATVSRGPAVLVQAHVDNQLTQRRFLEEWGDLTNVLRREPGVVGVSPSVMGQALIRFRSESRSATLIGADPEAQDSVTPLERHLVRGHYLGLLPDEVAVGWSLARELHLELGDRVHVSSAEGGAGSYKVAGIFDSGDDLLDRTRVLVPLRSGQGLLRTGSYVTGISLRLVDSFRANELADRLERLLGCDTDTWMRTNSGTLSLLGVQGYASALIHAFTLVSAALGIASVLSISVLQKSKQIGILKSVGARRKQILTVFALEGLIIGVIGSCVGAVLASGLIEMLSQIQAPVRPSGKGGGPLIPLTLPPGVLLQAVGTAILATVIAGLIPARRAARMDPIEVIRGG